MSNRNGANVWGYARVILDILEGEGSLPTEVVPAFYWHFIFNF